MKNILIALLLTVLVFVLSSLVGCENTFEELEEHDSKYCVSCGEELQTTFEKEAGIHNVCADNVLKDN